MSQAVEPPEEDEMTDSTVTLGEVEVDPVAIQDFRLSIEGTSGTGSFRRTLVELKLRELTEALALAVVSDGPSLD